METPLHEYREDFRVRAAEAGMRNRLTVAAFCGYLQEAAGNHARELGLGIQELRAEGLTWMLARLQIAFSRPAAWLDTVSIRTWPSGTRGRLTAIRDFEATGSAGCRIAGAVSEWLYVDVAAEKSTRLPSAFAELAPEGTPHVAMPPMPAKFEAWPETVWSAEIAVRASDQDFNRHVNNVHYADWMFEPLPETWSEMRELTTFDIQFRQAAHKGDRLAGEIARLDDTTLLHRIVRPADGALLAQARTVWTAR
ncbi:MAG: hypothetical protein J6U40_05125 [Kiritimatiellae bacterium]|nr:hypothetical protein [Kiritimatiellia bacterium]